jgi:hypothetical protein
MSDLRAAAQQALEAMEDLHRTGDTQVFDLCHRETTEALRAALEQPEPDAIEQALAHAEAFSRGHDAGWQSAIAHRAALEQTERCSCGDRPKGKCPGEWEPGCDMGNNPKYARRVPLEQEPVYWEYKHVDDGLERWNRVVPRTGQTLETAAAEIHGYRRGLKRPYEVRALYTAPPRREWRGLSEEEFGYIYVRSATHEEFARAIEAALRSKNYD